jgi:hypothetical protein
LRWHKRDADEHRKPHVVELYQRHGLQGLFFWDHLNDLLTEYFNFWCPGCYKFKTSIFYAYFYPYIKDKKYRMIKKMLRFLNDEKIIISSIGARTLYLYYPDIIDKADEYTKKCQKRAEDKEQEQPESARELAFECEQMSLYGASRMQDDARTFFEKKGVKH